VEKVLAVERVVEKVVTLIGQVELATHQVEEEVITHHQRSEVIRKQ
jgi:hypothetical protein